MSPDIYQLRILQDGELPLSPDGKINPLRKHRCTATLVWPAGVQPTRANSVVVDPSFTDAGWRCMGERLAMLGVSPVDIGFYFVTHAHYDHKLAVPLGVDRPLWRRWRPGAGVGLSGLAAVACPGHDPDLQAMKLASESGEVWIVGDAILDQDWLVDWSYFWPNGYDADEIVQTWRSVAAILSRARLIVPGHGPMIQVTVELIDRLIEGFASAPHASDCPEVAQALEFRRRNLAAGTR